MAKTGASGLGIDWSCSARNARYLSGGNITLQGNYDPAKLLSPISKIKSDVHQMINEFGKERYIVNLGHGILPNIPVSHAKAFVDAVKEYQIYIMKEEFYNYIQNLQLSITRELEKVTVNQSSAI